MPTITATIYDLGLTGPVPNGTVRLEVRLLSVQVGGGTVLTTVPLIVPFVNGMAEWVLPASAVGNGYTMLARGAGDLPMWTVAVPDLPSVTFSTLITAYLIDPLTLLPGVEPSPAWVQSVADVLRYTPQTLSSVQQAQARSNIGATAGAGGSGVELLQTVPSASWSFTIPAQFTRKPAVATYLSSGETVVADLVVSPTTVSVTFAAPATGSVVLT